MLKTTPHPIVAQDDPAHAPADTRMAALVARLAPSPGYTPSLLDAVHFMRVDGPVARTPVLYEPGIVVVVQGTKRGHLGGHTFVYDARHFLLLSMPLPFESETLDSGGPMLAVAIRLDLATAAEVALQVDALEAAAPVAPAAALAICATPLDAGLADAVLRLLQALISPLEAAVLGDGLLREIHYRVLTGAQGPALRATLARHSHFGQIGKALRRIHAGYREPLDVQTLASEAGASMATFHARFKAVTQTSPMQYLKSTRLHKARLLMVQDGLGAQAAAARVGYESASQFSREFKRFFGRSPRDEAHEMRHIMALRERTAGDLADDASPYVTYQLR